MSKKSSAAQVFTAGVDIKNFRDQPEEALEKWRENQRKRGRKPELIDEIVEQDKIYRASLKKKADPCPSPMTEACTRTDADATASAENDRPATSRFGKPGAIRQR